MHTCLAHRCHNRSLEEGLRIAAAPLAVRVGKVVVVQMAQHRRHGHACARALKHALKVKVLVVLVASLSLFYFLSRCPPLFAQAYTVANPGAPARMPATCLAMDGFSATHRMRRLARCIFLRHSAARSGHKASLKMSIDSKKQLKCSFWGKTDVKQIVPTA